MMADPQQQPSRQQEQPAEPQQDPAAPQQDQAPVQEPVQPAPPDSPQQQPNPEQNSQKPESFWDYKPFAGMGVSSGPQTPPISTGSRIMWFAVGFVCGIFGMAIVWIMTARRSGRQKMQPVMWTWLGFCVQAVLMIILMLSGSLDSLLGGTHTVQSNGVSGSYSITWD